MSKKSATRGKPKTTAHKRAWHVRISLHPVSIMIFLCAGVFLVASTIATFGDSYDVTATVPADFLSDPAIIMTPADGDHSQTQDVQVSGSCPDNSYVDLAIGGIFSGVAWCSAQTFTITALLQAGANQLSVQDYNVVNIAGPSSGTITVYYDPPAAPAPPPVVVPPIQLQIMQVDSGVAYVSQSTVEETSDLPTFQGLAPPFSTVTLLVHSDPIICTTQANAIGFWRCTLPTTLPVGVHTVNISAVTPSGQHLSLPQFKLHVRSAKLAAPAPPAVGPLTLSAPYQYQAYQLHQQVNLQVVLGGGQSPYGLSINWGDGHTDTYVKQTGGTITLSHIYTSSKSTLQAFTIEIQTVDGAGKTTVLQLIALIRNPNYHPPIAATSNGDWWHGLLTGTHSWLWILWPGYVIVVLMLLSFWLGERKQYDDDRHKRISHALRPKRKRHA